MHIKTKKQTKRNKPNATGTNRLVQEKKLIGRRVEHERT